MRFYPHELSGGMLQRAMIAMAILCRPRLLIADEPTTALDVTIAEQILRLLRALQREHGFAVFFISHDLELVGDFCDRIAVLYAGRVVETGTAARAAANGRDIRTRRRCSRRCPRHAQPGAMLPTVPGNVPTGLDEPLGLLVRRPMPARGGPTAPRGGRLLAPIEDAAERRVLPLGGDVSALRRDQRSRQGVPGPRPRWNARVRAVDGVDLAIEDGDGRSGWSASRARARRPSARCVLAAALTAGSASTTDRRTRGAVSAAARGAARLPAADRRARSADARRSARRGAAARTAPAAQPRRA